MTRSYGDLVYCDSCRRGWSPDELPGCCLVSEADKLGWSRSPAGDLCPSCRHGAGVRGGRAMIGAAVGVGLCLVGYFLVCVAGLLGLR